ncbi:MAG: acetyl-CoA decarbonylase/synthase complex subunit delta [Thermodesulfobacteriota bacterium]
MKSGSRLERILEAGHFAVTGELGPPKSGDPEVVRKKARILKGHVDAVNITDCQTAIVRMSSVAAGLLTLQEGVEPVVQMTCRDRNRIGMQSDILGAAALGLKNLLCLTGDHQKFGNHPGAKGVFDMDSIQLLGMVKGMRDDRQFQCGEAIKSAEPKLFVGCAANPFAFPHEFRAQRLAKKVANGADFVQTQIIYNVERFRKFMEMARDLGLHEKVKILAGVTPPKSLGMARYMKNFVPGMDVTDDVIKRLQGAKDKADEGINICVDIINQVREIEGVAGAHVMAIEWEEAVPEIVKRAGLDQRPVLDDDGAEVSAPGRETIEVSGGATPAVSAEGDEILAAAKAEAEKIIAAARAEAAAVDTPAAASVAAGEQDDAGEHEMNEKERQMALESVRIGLASLKKAFNLSDDQFEALANFAGAEAVLKKEHEAQAASAPAAAAPATPAPTPAAPVVDTAAEEAAKKAAADKAAADKAAADKEAADKAAADKAAAEKKASEDKAAAAAAAEKAAAEKKGAEEAAAAKAAAEKAAAAAPAAAPSGDLAVAALAKEETPLSERASKVPADSYTTKYNGEIREGVVGNEGNEITIGGATTMPFQLFEGKMDHKPLIAMDVVDSGAGDWPEPLKQHFSDVLDNPVAWAQKCIKEYQAEAICLSLTSTDPNGDNRDAAEAAKQAADVINAIDVPTIVWGCGNAEKDTDTLREITSLIGTKKVCLAPLEDANYRSLGATAMAFQHPIVAASPIDVNLAKQLNILLENLGVNLSSVMIDPSVGALGYGIEYTYSVMERIRLAALTQQDEKLQVPIICNLGREVWKAKECRLPSGTDNLGDQEKRSVMMEAITASCMMIAGGELLIMRHPKAVNLAKAMVEGLMG